MARSNPLSAKYKSEFAALRNAIHRCHNPDSKKYADYGGRGLTVHPLWHTDFQAFIDHIGPKPDPKLTLERLDNDKGYVPGNVAWVDRKTQMSNRRPKREPSFNLDEVVTHNGLTMSYRNWANHLDLLMETIRQRHRCGMPIEEILAPRKRMRNPTLVYQGKSYNLFELCRELNLPYNRTAEYLKRGHTIEEALTNNWAKFKPRSYGKKYTYMGETLTARQWSQRLGIKQELIYKRHKQGRPIEDVMYVGKLSEKYQGPRNRED